MLLQRFKTDYFRLIYTTRTRIGCGTNQRKTGALIAKSWLYQIVLLWRYGDPGKEPIEYQMKAHLFGSTSSPSCANFALRKTATDFEGHFSEEVINTVLRNVYVDDWLKSVRTTGEAISLVSDIQAVLKEGGFHISKWVSNNRKVMRSILTLDRAAEIKDLDLDPDSLPIERTFGVNCSIELASSLEFTW